MLSAVNAYTTHTKPERGENRSKNAPPRPVRCLMFAPSLGAQDEALQTPSLACSPILPGNGMELRNVSGN